MDARALIHDAEHARELGGLTISTTIHTAGSALAQHYHERAYFCFVDSGRFEEQAGGGTHRCGAELVLFHPRGEAHANVFEDTTHCLNVEVPAAFGLGADELGDAFRRRDQRRSGRLVAVARQIQRELRAADAASGLAIRGLVLELAAAWARVPPSGARRLVWLDEAIQILRVEYARGIEFRELAARVGVHPVQLSRAFRRAQGVTMTEFVNRLRTEHAARLLATTMRPIAAIALDVGFADQSHLAKVFRRYTGTTCARYRARS
jgi:AraC family transcriptional regulator